MADRRDLVKLVTEAREFNKNFQDMYQIIVPPDWNYPTEYLEEVNAVIRHADVPVSICCKAGISAQELSL